MDKHPSITLQRIERFLREFLEPRLYINKHPLKVEMAYMGVERYTYRTENEVRAATAAEPSLLQPMRPRDAWGPVWSTAWFRLTGTIPSDWNGETIALTANTGAESIVWANNTPSQGIDWAHPHYPIFQPAAGETPVEFWLESYGGNPNVSVHGRPKAPAPKPYQIGECGLVAYEPELVGLYFDMMVAADLLKALPEEEPRRARLLYALNAAVNLCVMRFPAVTTFTRVGQFDWLEGTSEWNLDAPTPAAPDLSPEQRSQYLAAARDARAVVQAEYDIPASPGAHQVSAMGHAHIDTAWLWPLWVTERKCAHTFATAVRSMEIFPEYKFICSQAAQYQWIKDQHPELFQRIKEKVGAGQWEPTGSMWVEADCNLASGESLVRQFLYGKRFFMKELGVETKDMFLPDVFGYAASLPQILRKCRIDYFLTQKISWNQTNKFPHHSFLWQGIDGSQVLTHFPPADTYNASMTAKELRFNVRNYKEHDRSNHSLYLYGLGDGGGGPTFEMLENLRRMRNVEGLPRVTPEFMGRFFRRLVSDYWELPENQTPVSEGLRPYYLDLPQRRAIPVWAGELYLELHRGTYTSQAKNKRDNRRAEFALREAEFLWCVVPNGLRDYPQAELEAAWKTVLLNQFHDIIPGSSIREVYRDSDRDYERVFEVTERLIEKAMGRLASAVNADDVFEPMLRVVTTPSSDGSNAYGYSVMSGKSVPAADPELRAGPRVLENSLIRIEFAPDGRIASIFDKRVGREALTPGSFGNEFQFFDDQPLFWDAWDIDPFYQETLTAITDLASAEVISEGGGEAALRQTRKFGNSSLSQTIRLKPNSALIEFVTEVDWHEESKMLKVAFPVQVNATKATYEVQYGHAERPTHQNTSWDMARFEVCAHKWADLSETAYGVSLLNDSKYGHDIHHNVMRLTLLRAPVAPDPECDRGRHMFTYALLPHPGPLAESGVIETAYALNSPPRIAPVNASGGSRSLPQTRSFFTVSRPGVIIEAVKKAEDDDGIIVRLYEAYNARGVVKLSTTLPVKEAYLCDMLEDQLEPMEVQDGGVSFPIAPFEILTLKLFLRETGVH